MMQRIVGMRLPVLIAGSAAGLVLIAGPGSAQAPSSSALAGDVISHEEGAMEGVLVSAKRTGSTSTVTVVSNEHGHYDFPRERLEPGQYSVTIRAVGYELPGRGPTQVEVPA